ncbi:hypothetical protein GCM10017708_13440 [Arthrobacter citreus]
MVTANNGFAGVAEAVTGARFGPIPPGVGGFSGRRFLLGGIVLACHYFLFHFRALSITAFLRIPVGFRAPSSFDPTGRAQRESEATPHRLQSHRTVT